MRFRVFLPVLLAALGAASPAMAGPPLLCHPYDIGDARSLPWDGAGAWWHGQSGYNPSHLVADTTALLTPSTPVVVRMETLRRAVIYASPDPKVAQVLLQTFTERARAAEQSGRADALAYLDAAYVSGAFREMVLVGESPEGRARAAGARTLTLDGTEYTLIQKALALRPDDAAIHFAAALIAADTNRAAYAAHAAKARAGVSRDRLLARNIDHVS
jgi:hypothetical protein